MKPLFAAFLMLDCFALVSARAGPRRSAEPELNGRLQARLSAQFAALATGDSPGFAVLVKQNGKVLFERGFGVRDLREKAKINPRTNFRLASCTKQFTAMAVMLLVRDGKLRYDETLTQIFPEFPAYGTSITVRHLLNHTSGLPDYEDLMDAAEKSKGPVWSPQRQIRDEEVLQLLKEARQGKFAAGSKWEYSNSGYVLLGLIVAKRSSRPFGEFVRERIFAPLGMERALVFEKGTNKIRNRAYGHSRKEGLFVETDQSSTSATQGDGGVYANLEDLNKWDDALEKHSLLSESEFRVAITPASLPPRAEQKLAEDAPTSLRGKAASYGFGWFLDLQNPRPLMWHYGDSMGFKSAILRYFEANLSVIVLCNRSDLDAGTLALEATEAAAGWN